MQNDTERIERTELLTMSDVRSRMEAEPIEDDAPNGTAQLHELADNLRAAADVIERMAGPDYPFEPNVVATINLYTDSAEEFRLCALRIGHATKEGSGDMFWLTRKFGENGMFVKFDVNAPDREAVCEKRVVGVREVPESIFVKTGRMVEEEVVEWNCNSILRGTAVD